MNFPEAFETKSKAGLLFTPSDIPRAPPRPPLPLSLGRQSFVPPFPQSLALARSLRAGCGSAVLGLEQRDLLGWFFG